MTTTENNVAAQAGDEQAALATQLSIWRAEVARLNDLIAHASGVQAGDEPMRAAFEAKYIPGTVYRSQWNDGSDYANFETEVRWRLFKDGAAFAAQVSPRATADVERDAARYRWLLNNYARGDGYTDIDAALNEGEPEKYLSPAIDAAILITTKPGA